MEGDNTTQQAINQKNPRQYRIHKILAHSYSVYFILFLVGVGLDAIFRFQIFSSSIMRPVGLAFLIIASFLILWAQHTSRNLDMKNLTKETFCKGPYCYTRHPTHWGLFLLMLGFGIMVNALFVILFTLIAFILTKFFFVEKQENILAEKYGTPYLEYKKLVKF